MSVSAGFWIGHPGAMLPLPNLAGSLSRSVERAASYQTSAAGNRRAYLSARRAPLREWSVAIPAMFPDEAAILHGLLMGTDPPYVWVDPWSQATNLLTPATVSMRDSIPALAPLGRQPLLGGSWAPVAGSNPTGAVVNLSPAPVVPQLPVTVSAYLGSAGAASVSAVFYTSGGTQLTVNTSATVSGLGSLKRAFVTAMPPANASAVAIRVTGASIIACPAVTWSADLLDFGAGGGVAQVLVTAIAETFSQASPRPGGRRSELSFTVTEVG